MPSWSPLALLAVVLVLVITHLAVPSTRGWLWMVAGGLGLLALTSLIYLGLVWAPPEAFMSDVGRILYVHVPYIWMCMLAFTINVGCAIAYLMKKSWRTDALAEASAEVGVLFGAGGVLMGSIWARPTWGVWWDWDPSPHRHHGDAPVLRGLPGLPLVHRRSRAARDVERGRQHPRVRVAAHRVVLGAVVELRCTRCSRTRRAVDCRRCASSCGGARDDAGSSALRVHREALRDCPLAAELGAMDLPPETAQQARWRYESAHS